MAKRNHKPEPRSAAKFPYHRRLKVREGRNYYQPNTYPRPYRAPPPVPWVNIKGFWLDKAGFAIGTELEVTVRRGKITLTALPNE